MNKLLVVFLIFSFLLTNISALCEEGQIDINTASAEELQNIIQIGSVRADEIIELRAERLFESVDDLVRVLGIVAGGSRLTQIKEQGLACVNGVEEDEEKENGEVDEAPQEIESLPKETEPIELQTINLNPQVIKSEDDNENLGKSNYAIYGFVAFCILIGILFMVKNRKDKNEFR